MDIAFFDEKLLEKKLHPVIFLVDTASYMCGEMLERVNAFLDSFRLQLTEYNRNSKSSEARLSVLSFGTAARWECDMLDPEEPVPYLTAEGLCNMGNAFSLLREWLRKAYTQESLEKFTLPTITLISGEFFATDNAEGKLSELKENGLFRRAIRLSVYMCENVNQGLVDDFSTNIETRLEFSKLASVLSLLFPKGGAISLQEWSAAYTGRPKRGEAQDDTEHDPLLDSWD